MYNSHTEGHVPLSARLSFDSTYGVFTAVLVLKIFKGWFQNLRDYERNWILICCTVEMVLGSSLSLSFFLANWVTAEQNMLWTKISLNTHQKARLLAQFSTESTNYAIFVTFPVNCRVQQNRSVWSLALCKCSLNDFSASFRFFSRYLSVLGWKVSFQTQTCKTIVQKKLL